MKIGDRTTKGTIYGFRIVGVDPLAFVVLCRTDEGHDSEWTIDDFRREAEQDRERLAADDPLDEKRGTEGEIARSRGRANK